ncbi:hypothetical protein TNIN_372331 [Trichonephila inaurata madagascariensis]|uniref:Uncharacterized protein n=1 Tax=Trichonephila inaurata madagascariensis TaxID=2747483 RepID=A0A8X6X9R2_9ARAC|nr:hypothetical protein TNIN_372331 [Trichonephila inaurata madagascariensis]
MATTSLKTSLFRTSFNFTKDSSSLVSLRKSLKQFAWFPSPWSQLNPDVCNILHTFSIVFQPLFRLITDSSTYDSTCCNTERCDEAEYEPF